MKEAQQTQQKEEDKKKLGSEISGYSAKIDKLQCTHLICQVNRDEVGIMSSRNGRGASFCSYSPEAGVYEAELKGAGRWSLTKTKLLKSTTRLSWKGTANRQADSATNCCWMRNVAWDPAVGSDCHPLAWRLPASTMHSHYAIGATTTVACHRRIHSINHCRKQIKKY